MVSMIWWYQWLVEHMVKNDDNLQLLRPFTIDEFREAIFQTHPDNSLESVDLIHLFFKNIGQ